MTETTIPNTHSSRVGQSVARVMAGISALLGGLWALITYVFPDPSVFGFGFINWKNVILLVSVFLFLGTLSIAWQARKLPELVRGFLQLTLASVLAVGFFFLGSEYAKPTFDFAKAQAAVVENDGANLLGKRLEALDNVRFELKGCESIGLRPSCTLELTNTNVDRQFYFSSSTVLFDENGGPISLDSLRVGQSTGSSYSSLQLIRNVPTQVTLLFQPSSRKLQHTPALKLFFNNSNGDTQVLKFSDIDIQ